MLAEAMAVLLHQSFTVRPRSTDHSLHTTVAAVCVCVSGARVAVVHHDTGRLPVGVRRDDTGAAVPDARQGPLQHAHLPRHLLFPLLADLRRALSRGARRCVDTLHLVIYNYFLFVYFSKNHTRNCDVSRHLVKYVASLCVAGNTRVQAVNTTLYHTGHTPKS